MRKTLLLILLLLPMICFGQDEEIEKIKFNFNKSNNYNALEQEPISNENYSSISIFDSEKTIKKHNDKGSNDISYTTNNPKFYPFNKGLIQIISEVMEKGSDNKPFTLQKDEEKPNNQYKNCYRIK